MIDLCTYTIFAIDADNEVPIQQTVHAENAGYAVELFCEEHGNAVQIVACLDGKIRPEDNLTSGVHALPDLREKEAQVDPRRAAIFAVADAVAFGITSCVASAEKLVECVGASSTGLEGATVIRCGGEGACGPLADFLVSLVDGVEVAVRLRLVPAEA